MKKGFTLIELLAVILILGIIALIAIPTVNKIISEARYGAFKSGNENIMKTIEQDCQTSIIKGENPILSYVFTEGKSNAKINVKGSFPNEGYIFLNDNCNITEFYLKSQNNVHSNVEEVKEDYMLKASVEKETSIFKSMYPDYFDNIISVSFIDNLNIPENAIEIKDPSISEKGNIKSWLIPNGEFYDLYIGSEKNIYTNYNSSNLFRDLRLVTNYNFININTKLTQNMQSVFYNNRALVEIDISKFDTSNVTNLRAFFCYCIKLSTINNLENLDTSRNTTFRSMFYDCNNLKTIDLSTWDVGNVTDMRSMFNNCNKLSSIGNVSNWNTKNLVIMTKIFDSCVFTNLDLSGWITDKVTNMEYLFGSDDNKITSLTSLYIDRFNFNNVVEMGGIFHKAENLSYIKINDGLSINLIIEYLPDRTSTSTGTINVTGDKTNINTEALLIKNWNIV